MMKLSVILILTKPGPAGAMSLIMSVPISLEMISPAICWGAILYFLLQVMHHYIGIGKGPDD